MAFTAGGSQDPPRLPEIEEEHRATVDDEIVDLALKFVDKARKPVSDCSLRAPQRGALADTFEIACSFPLENRA
jgi:hypothetical protein